MHPGIPFPGDAELAARGNARRNTDGDVGILPDAPFPAADGAWVRDDFPGAVAGGAGGLLDEKAALLGNDAAPLAGRTGLERFLSIPGPGTVAGLASHQTLNLKLLGASLRSLFQRDVQIIAQIGTGSLGGPFLAAAAGASEHIRKTAHSGKHLGENIHRILEPSPGITAARSGTALFKGGMAEAVVGSPLVRIGKHLIGLSQLLELFFCGRVVRVAVRMVL